MTAPAIELRGLGHAFGAGATPALLRADLEVPRGSFVSIVGPSGCGKTTILRILAGLITPTEGEAFVGGVSAIGRPGLVAYMPQKDALLPWRRALDNATLGAEVRGVSRKLAREQARALFPRFGLTGFERAWPVQLSGGMRQRLALLRTFLTPGDVLLLDEPFGALDAITRREMHTWLQEVWAADQRTVLFITHDVEEALVLSETVYVMTPRPGQIAARVDVPFARPRPPTLVTEPTLVALKAHLLAALDSAVRGA
jgi:ABC-type nitrate/sulfonate/bicarbonate transport system ATPase subunit